MSFKGVVFGDRFNISLPFFFYSVVNVVMFSISHERFSDRTYFLLHMDVSSSSTLL